AALATRAGATPATTTSTAAFAAAVARAHGIDAGAQRIWLTTRRGRARAGLADAQAAQMGVGSRLALGAGFALFTRATVFPWRAVHAVTAVGLLARRALARSAVAVAA